MPRVGAPSIAIIGSGLAGGLLASKLARWAAVTVFERGGPGPTRPAPPQVEGAPLGLAHTHCYGLGGTTNLWRGSLLAMRPDEFGPQWPGPVAADVHRYAPRVVELLYGPTLAGAWERTHADVTGSDVLDIALAPGRPARLAARGWWREVEIRLGEHVEVIEEAASGVVVRTSGAGGLRRYRLDAAVIAAGALNSPLLLGRSRLGGADVGENLTDHPMGLVAKVSRAGPSALFDRMLRDGPWRRVAKFQDGETGLWTTFQLCPSHDPDLATDPYGLGYFERGRSLTGLRSKLLNPEYRALLASKALGRPWLGRHAYVLAMSEQEALGQGRVQQGVDGSTDLHWCISDAVAAATERSLLRLANWLGAELRLPTSGVRGRLWSGAHHAGGCRLSADAGKGVVDPDLKLHGATNIWVCDASVLPSTGASNTGLTIGALALRLEAHMRRALH